MCGIWAHGLPGATWLSLSALCTLEATRTGEGREELCEAGHSSASSALVLRLQGALAASSPPTHLRRTGEWKRREWEEGHSHG